MELQNGRGGVFLSLFASLSVSFGILRLNWRTELNTAVQSRERDRDHDQDYDHGHDKDCVQYHDKYILCHI